MEGGGGGAAHGGAADGGHGAPHARRRSRARPPQARPRRPRRPRHPRPQLLVFPARPAPADVSEAAPHEMAASVRTEPGDRPGQAGHTSAELHWLETKAMRAELAKLAKLAKPDCELLT